MKLLLLGLAWGHGSDADDDDWPDSVDCQVDNHAVYPGAPELCNLVDDDCDGEIDEQCEDRDEDGGCSGGDTGLALLLLPLLVARRSR